LDALFVDESSPVQSTFLQNIQLRRFIALCHRFQIRLAFNWSSCQGLCGLSGSYIGTGCVNGRQIRLGFCRVSGHCLLFSDLLVSSAWAPYVTVWPANSYVLLIITDPSWCAVSIFWGSSTFGLALILAQRSSKSPGLSCFAVVAFDFALASSALHS
jgi:hypothetical protein